MFAALLADGRLYELLQRFDEDLAAEHRACGCPRCAGVLHSARYPRKPRGFAGRNPEYDRRLRPSPDSETLRQAFTRTEKRTQRQSDGTLVIEARRFEVPNRYRHLRALYVRYAQWDLSSVYLIDERSGEILCRLYPQDKRANARGVRRPLEPLAGAAPQRGSDAANIIDATAPRTEARMAGAAARQTDGATNRYGLATRLPAQG